MYIIMCKINRLWEFALCCRELKPLLCGSLEGWDGTGGGKEVQGREDICISYCCFLLDMPVIYFLLIYAFKMAHFPLCIALAISQNFIFNVLNIT